MGIGAQLLSLVRAVDEHLSLPSVTALYLPPPTPDPTIEAEFALVVLADGSAGFFFALLGDTLQRLHREVDRGGAVGVDPMTLCAGIESDDPVIRAVALGAISAVSQHLFRRARLVLPAAGSSLGGMDFSSADRVGMVGLFPSLARRLREQDIPLTVIELRADRVQSEGNFQVTLDPAQLRGCNKVLCTASTLLNDSLDEVLGHCTGAQEVALIGPSASCFPDPLFQRGIHVVGGSEVRDAKLLLSRLDRGQRWGDAVRRYTLDSGSYPGIQALLERAGEQHE